MSSLLGKTPAAALPDPSQPGWMKMVPVMTGVLAALAGYLTVRSSNLSDDAIYRSNQAVLFQAQSSDAWSEYQADSVKSRVVETQLTAGTAKPESEATLKEEASGLRDRQPPLKVKALDLAAKRDAELLGGNKLLGEKDIISKAGMAIQLGIALASVAAITRKRPAFMVALACGALGAGLTGYALWVHHFA